VPAFKVTPFPARGQAPLDVNFNLCPTADPDNDKIVFFFDYGDGTTAQGPPCRQQNTYKAGRYTANMCVWDLAARARAAVLSRVRRGREVGIGMLAAACPGAPSPTLPPPW
jgi:hypothetical protein